MFYEIGVASFEIKHILEYYRSSGYSDITDLIPV